MGYCSINDVEVLMPQEITFNTTTKPTKVQVQQVIDNVAARIDAQLAHLYTVPITGARSLKIVSYVNAIGVVARLNIPAMTSEGEIDSSHKDSAREEFKTEMEFLLSAQIPLSDAVSNTTTSVQSVHAYDEIAFTKAKLDGFIKDSKI